MCIASKMFEVEKKKLTSNCFLIAYIKIEILRNLGILIYLVRNLCTKLEIPTCCILIMNEADAMFRFQLN